MFSRGIEIDYEMEREMDEEKHTQVCHYATDSST